MKKDDKTKIRKPIVRRLIFWIGIPLFIVYSAVLVMNYSWSKRDALQQTKEYLIELTSHYAVELNSRFVKIAQTPAVISDALQTLKMPTEEEIYSLISKRLESNPSIYGMAIAFEPFSFNKGIEYFSPYHL